MRFSDNLIVASLFAIASSFVQAATMTSSSHPLTTVNSQNDFCLFLPPQPGLVVAVNEDNGIPFCVKKDAVPNATAFPKGFITTAHYLKTSKYVQVTGFLDRSKYKLKSTDGGGQYDNHSHGKPVGAQCKGYKYFVSLIEPDINRFCIRCCQETADCNTGRSGYGCLRVVAGDYTNDNNFINGGTKNSTKTATKHNNSHMNSVYSELDELPSTATTNDDTTSSNANQEIAAEIESIKADITNQTPVDQIQANWNTFADKLATEYSQVSSQIQQLSTFTASLTTTDQWAAFINLVSEKIVQLQSAEDDSTASSGEGVSNYEDASTSTTTADESTSSTHTDKPEDLEWLFEHRNSHDNQATW